MCCLQHEGDLSKAPLHQTVATALMDLLHVDFTSIEITPELNRLPRVANVLVFQDHFTKHIMAYVTPNQTAKTVAKYLYQGYISLFGALARLLSNWGANFMSSITDEMWNLLGMKKLRTMPYHPQMNGQVERSHNYNANDWEAGRRHKGWLARTPGWNSACLQYQLICCDGV